MKQYIDLYIENLKQEDRKSENTLRAYRRDLEEFHQFLKEQQVNEMQELSNVNVVAFLMKLHREGRSTSTMNRKMASLRSYAAFLCREKILSADPTRDIHPPKAEKKEVEYLTTEEVEAILNAPDESVKGIRDRAILELMYGTGLRATELTELQLDQVNFRIGFITVQGEHVKARIVPMGKLCRFALGNYIETSRPQLLEVHRRVQRRETERKETIHRLMTRESSEAAIEDSPYLFVNHNGEKLTRQGLWKIIRSYAEKAGIERAITPQLLRNSFAVHMLQNGADLKSMQELMGYEDITTTQIYLQATKNRIKEVYDRTHPRA